MDTEAGIADKLLSVMRLWEEASETIYSGVRTDDSHPWFHLAGYEVLNQIDSGITTTKDLAAKANSTMANITHVTKVLEKSGCIEREVSKNDRRVWNFHVTRKGKDLLHIVRSHHSAAVKHFCSQFTEDQKKSVLTFLDAIETHLDQFIRLPAEEREKLLHHGHPELEAHFGHARALGKQSTPSKRVSAAKRTRS